jgi:hypothetical protein
VIERAKEFVNIFRNIRGSVSFLSPHGRFSEARE